MIARGPQDERSYALRASLLARPKTRRRSTALYDELQPSPSPIRARLLLGQTAEFLERYDEALDLVPRRARRPAALVSASCARPTCCTNSSAPTRPTPRCARCRPTPPPTKTRAATRTCWKPNCAPRTRTTPANSTPSPAAWPRSRRSGDPLYARALIWERRDDIPRAEADFRRILVAEPDNVAALNALGYTLADRTTRYQEALELIDRARVAEPDNAAIIDSYGWVLYRLGRNDEALVELRRAFALQKDPEIAAHLGEVLWVIGNKDEARKYFDEARKLDPDNRSLQARAARRPAHERAVAHSRRCAGVSRQRCSTGRCCRSAQPLRDGASPAHRFARRRRCAQAPRAVQPHAREARAADLGHERPHRAVQRPQWRQRPHRMAASRRTRYDVSLSAPVTRQSWRLSGDAAGARLEGLEGGPREGADAEATAARSHRLGHPGARAVGLGARRRAPTRRFGAAQMEFGADGRLARIEQAGWTIDYARLATGGRAGVASLPGRLEATQRRGQGPADHRRLDARRDAAP